MEEGAPGLQLPSCSQLEVALPTDGPSLGSYQACPGASAWLGSASDGGQGGEAEGWSLGSEDRYGPCPGGGCQEGSGCGIPTQPVCCPESAVGTTLGGVPGRENSADRSLSGLPAAR